VALPEQHEESEPFFKHHDEGELPLIEEGGKRVRIIAGPSTARPRRGIGADAGTGPAMFSAAPPPEAVKVAYALSLQT